ncbi:metallophosphoesterase [Methylomarinum sp. Ch1-1]|uniref:Metallophosphoesterase n=1 Tax=Methylomarinum roseum TaxID=3067653 RepID=A0AAU7NQ43_9GAMM|nr:metallophosphoesterase [Methylomarinum sp. Ch1-1]MDP4520961.1 metallophosphoesterase [Methylomarinum sp. Ch1-1]
MRINYFSDIHLEFGELAKPENDAELIIAAGDIGVYEQGVEWLKSLNKKVVYVAGNHEFYANEYNDTLRVIRAGCEGSNIVFLENEILIYQGVRFLGCTLWADLFAEGDEKALALGASLNDFRKITYKDYAFNQKIFSKLYQRSRQWLVEQLEQPFEGKTVVITHHAPTEWSWNDAPSALKKLAYCNDLKELFHQYEIAAWFHGHVHSLGDYRIAGARILSNPRGYYGRKLVEQFDVNRTVTI